MAVSKSAAEKLKAIEKAAAANSGAQLAEAEAKETAPAQLEHPAYSPAAAQEGKEIAGHLDMAELLTWKLDDLKKLAEDMGVDAKALRTKADYAAAIAAVEVTAPAEDAEAEAKETAPAQLEQPADSPADAQEEAAADGAKAMVVYVGLVNLRSAPAMKPETIVEQARQGQTFRLLARVTAEDEAWLKLKTTGDTPLYLKASLAKEV